MFAMKTGMCHNKTEKNNKPDTIKTHEFIKYTEKHSDLYNYPHRETPKKYYKKILFIVILLKV